MVFNTFIHIQGTASNVWHIAHNLGHPPISDVTVDYNGDRVKFMPYQVVHIDMNNLEIRFSVPRTGEARLL